jgi:hypothetical protein
MLSCPSVSLATPEIAQETFDRLVREGTYLSTSAPAGDKLAALRSMSTKELEALLHGQPAQVSYDEEWFVDLAKLKNLRIDNSSWYFPSWVGLIAVGMTKEETALFSQQWQALSSIQLSDAWKSVLPISTREEVFRLYGISASVSNLDLVASTIDYTTDCIFAKATHSIAETAFSTTRDGQGTFLYSFDQRDLTSKIAAFKGKAYHSLDNAFLFHLPPVASGSAPTEFQATADAYSKACIDVVNSNHPWESYSLGKRCMIFDGARTRLAEEKERDCEFRRWGKFVNTDDREENFKAGRQLLYMAMKYGMALETDSSKSSIT